MGAASFAYAPRTASIASRISASPGRKTSTSPAGSRSSSRSAVTIAVDVVGLSARFVSLACAVSGGRYRISTGYVRPDTSMIGAGLPAASAKCFAKLSGSIVADVMMTLRSGRCGSMRVRYPSRKSTLSERSCASSTMIVS